MSEFDSPNYAEFTYDKKNEGKIKKQRRLMMALYVAFAIAFATVCFVTKLVPLVAVVSGVVMAGLSPPPHPGKSPNKMPMASKIEIFFIVFSLSIKFFDYA